MDGSSTAMLLLSSASLCLGPVQKSGFEIADSPFADAGFVTQLFGSATWSPLKAASPKVRMERWAVINAFESGEILIRLLDAENLRNELFSIIAGVNSDTTLSPLSLFFSENSSIEQHKAQII